MLSALFRVRLLALKSWFTGASRSKKARSKAQIIGFVCLMLYAFGAFASLFWSMFDNIALPFHQAGLDWLYFAMAALMGFGLMFVGSVFTAKAQLYEARDNDLLLSMPVPPGYILLSRMFMLWVIALAMELLSAVPALLVWRGQVGFDGQGLAAYLLIFLLLLPVLAAAVSALFGWLLHLLTARVGNQSLLTVLLSLAFLAVYFYAVSQMNLWIERLVQNPELLARNLGPVAPLVLIGRAVAEGDGAALLIVAFSVLAMGALAWLLLSRSFLSSATRDRLVKRKKYVENPQEQATPRQALLRREWRRFLASPAYILNCGLGALMALMAAAAVIIKRKTILALMAQEFMSELLPMLLLLGLCFMAATVLVTAPSVSLEGKTLWIAKSLPVDTWEVLLAKLRLHVLVGVPPMLIASMAVTLALGIRGTMQICLTLVPAVYTVFMGLLGLAENLRHPNFDWINETQAVKSGASILLTMFIGWGLLMLPLLGFLFLDGLAAPEQIALGFLAVLVLASLLLYRWLRRRGVTRYLEL